jgi:hypothetical protein
MKWLDWLLCHLLHLHSVKVVEKFWDGRKRYRCEVCGVDIIR